MRNDQTVVCIRWYVRVLARSVSSYVQERVKGTPKQLDQYISRRGITWFGDEGKVRIVSRWDQNTESYRQDVRYWAADDSGYVEAADVCPDDAGVINLDDWLRSNVCGLEAPYVQAVVQPQ